MKESAGSLQSTDRSERGPDQGDLLLLQASAHWQQGNWESLIRIDDNSLEGNPDRARIALLIAAAYLQMKQPEKARFLIQRSREWGGNRISTVRILISNVHNSIARSAAVSGDSERAGRHFDEALSTGLPGCDTATLASVRKSSQLRDLGLIPGIDGCLQRLQAEADIGNQVGSGSMTEDRPEQPANADAMEFYHQIGKGDSPGAPSGFLLIDSKSLPRSGIHYLKNTLARLLGEHFSFCEWYHEVGCCRQRPCAITGYALHARDRKVCRIRLIKSHDFELSDPVLEPCQSLQRLILVRDPLFTLTSWFELDQLSLHRKAFEQHGINMEKVLLSHERELLDPACRILDTCFKQPSTSELTAWLVERSNYVIGFMNRWAKPAMERPNPHVHLISYNEIDRFVIDTANAFRFGLSQNAIKSLDEFSNRDASGFRQRLDPFLTRSASVSEFIGTNSSLFKAAACQIREKEQSGYFRSISD